MGNTVDELRNDIRVSTGRFEREISAAFTKEDLAALCDVSGAKSTVSTYLRSRKCEQIFCRRLAYVMTMSTLVLNGHSGGKNSNQLSIFSTTRIDTTKITPCSGYNDE